MDETSGSESNLPAENEAGDEIYSYDDPLAPWRVDESWSSGKISCLNSGATIAVTFFAVLWLGVAIPFNLFAIEELYKTGSSSHPVGMTFLSIGALLALLAVRQLIRWQKFGTSIFEIRNGTGEIGGTLTGVIRCSNNLKAIAPYTIKLSCYGKKKKNQSLALQYWNHEVAVPAGASSMRTGIPVSFSIPENCQPTSKEEGVSWNLRIKIPTKGVDYSTIFEVPVFKIKRRESE